MALISAKTIITSLSFFHLTLAFFFLTNPAAVADQAVVYLLGESMGLPDSRAFETQSPALAFLGVVLGLFGLTDLVTLSLPDEIGLVHHWGLQGISFSPLLPPSYIHPLTYSLPAPIRLTLTFFLTLYSFFFSPSSPLFYNQSSPAHSEHSPSSSSSSSSRLTHPSAHAANPHYAPSTWGGDFLKNRVFFTFMFVEAISWLWVWVTLQEERREVVARRARRRSSGSGSFAR